MQSALGLGVWLHAIAMLAVVVGLIAALGWALRRWGNGAGGAGFSLTPSKTAPRYRITHRMVLTPQHTLLELETPSGPQTLVLGPQGATILPEAYEKAIKTAANPVARRSVRNK
jgi:hypothetical protein